MDTLEELRQLIKRHAGTGGRGTTDVWASSCEAPTEVVHHVMEPTFVVVAQGAKRAMLGDEMFEYGQGQFLVVGVELPIAGCVSQASPELPYLGVGLAARVHHLVAAAGDGAGGRRDGAHGLRRL